MRLKYSLTMVVLTISKLDGGNSYAYYYDVSMEFSLYFVLTFGSVNADNGFVCHDYRVVYVY